MLVTCKNIDMYESVHTMYRVCVLDLKPFAALSHPVSCCSSDKVMRQDQRND